MRWEVREKGKVAPAGLEPTWYLALAALTIWSNEATQAPSLPILFLYPWLQWNQSIVLTLNWLAVILNRGWWCTSRPIARNMNGGEGGAWILCMIVFSFKGAHKTKNLTTIKLLQCSLGINFMCTQLKIVKEEQSIHYYDPKGRLTWVRPPPPALPTGLTRIVLVDRFWDLYYLLAYIL